jgi:aspartate racemase
LEEKINQSKHIGIVAVSAEGAALCYRTICLEGSTLLGPHCHPEITMDTYPLRRYMCYIEAGQWKDAGQLLLSSASKLVDAGAQLLICPDNTLHQSLDHVRYDISVPWLHIAEEVAAVAAEQGYKRLGILGTRYLMEGPVYPSKLSLKGIAWDIPGREDRSKVNDVIYNELVYGRFEEKSRKYFQKIITDLGASGCEAVVLGCTEIPLLISETDSPLPTLDSTRILARSALHSAVQVV